MRSSRRNRIPFKPPLRIRWAISALAVFPFLVGFAPPDTSGTFVSFFGGHGAYPSASCSQVYQNTYSEYGGALEEKIHVKTEDDLYPQKWYAPQYISFGLQGDKGPYRQLTVSSDLNEGGTVMGPTRIGEIRLAEGYSYGLYLGLDWKRFGLDVGIRHFKIPGDGDGSGEKTIPRLGIRVGTADFFTSLSFAEGMPFMADGEILEGGIGSQLNKTTIWGGVGFFPLGFPTGILRLRQDFRPLALNLSLTVNPGERSRSAGIENNYAVAASLDYRLPTGH